MFRKILHRLYEVSEHVDRFRRDHPGKLVLATGPTKFAQTIGDEALQWGRRLPRVLRGVLIVTSDELFCATTSAQDFSIPVSAIRQAILVETRGTSRFFLLKIGLENGVWYQFGLEFDSLWENNLPFPVVKQLDRGKGASFGRRLLVSLAVFALIFVLTLACLIYLFRLV